MKKPHLDKTLETHVTISNKNLTERIALTNLGDKKNCQDAVLRCRKYYEQTRIVKGRTKVMLQCHFISTINIIISNRHRPTVNI